MVTHSLMQLNYFKITQETSKCTIRVKLFNYESNHFNLRINFQINAYQINSTRNVAVYLISISFHANGIK